MFPRRTDVLLDLLPLDNPQNAGWTQDPRGLSKGSQPVELVEDARHEGKIHGLVWQRDLVLNGSERVDPESGPFRRSVSQVAEHDILNVNCVHMPRISNDFCERYREVTGPAPNVHDCEPAANGKTTEHGFRRKVRDPTWVQEQVSSFRIEFVRAWRHLSVPPRHPVRWQ